MAIKGKIIAFITGGVLGAGIAMLFAPRSGTETRAILTDKAEELWGEGQELYNQSTEKVKTEAAHVQATASQANDELRAKIESARTAIAEQVAKNAQSARDAINSQVPVTGEKIDQAADVIKGQVGSAARTAKSTTADGAVEKGDPATAAKDVTDTAGAGGGAGEAMTSEAKEAADKAAEANKQ